MILTYHTGACIRASAGEMTLVFAPVSRSSAHFKPTNFGADIALVPLNHPDMNGVGEAGRGDKQPFAIFGPGEYEIRGIHIAGFPTQSSYGGGGRINTAYAVSCDGVRMLYLGAIGKAAMPAELLEMDAPDVLIIPIGGNGVLQPDDAHELAVLLGAKVVIPILYDDRSLAVFIKEAGSEEAQRMDKLTIKPKDIAGKENEVVILGV